MPKGVASVSMVHPASRRERNKYLDNTSNTHFECVGPAGYCQGCGAPMKLYINSKGATFRKVVCRCEQPTTQYQWGIDGHYCTKVPPQRSLFD